MTDSEPLQLHAPYRPVVLLVLDGFGVNPDMSDSTWQSAKLPSFTEMERLYPFTTLQASGAAVGLPWGEEGNSEVGHLTIGAGRVMYHHLPRIIVSIQDGTFFTNEALRAAGAKVKTGSGRFHVLGLFSSGSVHAYADHLYALLEFAKREALPEVFLHLFTDGRDAPPQEAAKFMRQLEERVTRQYPFARIASVVGRQFAMDRDGHWDRIAAAYNLLTKGEGAQYAFPSRYIAESYLRGRKDEDLLPAALEEGGKTIGRINNGDAAVFFNFREDSARELAHAFVDERFDGFLRERLRDLLFVTMTEYERGMPALVASPPMDIGWPLSRVISEAGLRQLHVAETEKYAHVTYFFNGGREQPFPGEERMLIPSPQTAYVNEVPEMSAAHVTDAVLKGMARYDFILANFANADMVGHTGDFAATVKALEVLDFSVGRIVAAVRERGGAAVVTADHGNAEEKRYRMTGERRTKHSANPVPCYIVANGLRLQEPRDIAAIAQAYRTPTGVLTDIAPTILQLLSLERHPDMTGVSVLARFLPETRRDGIWERNTQTPKTRRGWMNDQ